MHNNLAKKSNKVTNILSKCRILSNYESVTITIRPKLYQEVWKFYKNDMLKIIEHFASIIKAVFRDTAYKYVFNSEEYSNHPWFHKCLLHFHMVIQIKDYELYNRKLYIIGKRLGNYKNRRLNKFRDILEAQIYLRKHFVHNTYKTPIYYNYGKEINIITPKIGHKAGRDGGKHTLGLKTIDILSYYQ